ncbi:uncharacterized protein PG998_010640 [Apiospora kogelbergensis]|uniref:Uncharacterized protein n=1 Tax=Apiospora kogelbergensis TaxID=1337665 RepID=A0AAW0RDY2_9PEZI
MARLEITDFRNRMWKDRRLLPAWPFNNYCKPARFAKMALRHWAWRLSPKRKAEKLAISARTDG